MNKLFTAAILTLAVMLVIPLAGYAATPMEAVKTGVDKVLATLTDPAFKAEPKDQQVAQLTEAINTIFDFEELSKRTLGKGWKNMNDAQQKEFVQLFTELLQGVYADRKLFLTRKTRLKRELPRFRVICRRRTARRYRFFTGSRTKAALGKFTT